MQFHHDQTFITSTWADTQHGSSSNCKTLPTTLSLALDAFCISHKRQAPAKMTDFTTARHGNNTGLCNGLFLSSYFKKTPGPRKLRRGSMNVDWIYNNQHSWCVRTLAGATSSLRPRFRAKMATNPGVPLWIKWVWIYVLMWPFNTQRGISWRFLLSGMRMI